ncbi:MAG: hypothetical protein WCH46_04795 [bacterium]
MVYETFRPESLPRNTPVLIILHGYGADEFDLLPIAERVGAKILTISIRAPIALSWGGFAWCNLSATATGFTPDLKTRLESEAMLVREIPKIIKTEGADPTQTYLMGFSQGAALCYSLMASTALSESGITVKGVMALSGYIPEDAREKLSMSDLSSTSFFVSHGRFDDLISMNEMYAAKNILNNAHAKTFAKEYEIGHGLTEETVSDLRSWINELLPN